MKKYVIEAGFSLVEMAVVVAIMGLLMAGLLPMITNQIDQQHRVETRKLMEDIRGALVGYAATQTPPKLPCPAKVDIVTGAANAGVADCTITPSGNAITGVLPWVTLGTSETDAWGRRFTYSVPVSAVNSYTGGFSLSSSSPINVLSTNAGIAIASGVPAVLISHGQNGIGAWTPQGTQIPTTGISADEGANADGSAPFVSHDFASDFDDLVIWISPNTLFNRMVSAGKLP